MTQPVTNAELDNLRAINADMRAALLAIANMKIGSNTDSAQLSALCIATARAAIAKATGREQDQ